MTSVRDVARIPGILDEFLVVGFEDIRERGAHRDSDFNDFIFAVRASYNRPQGGGVVPEPSTYGLMGAAVLLLAIAWRRRRCAA